MDSTCSTPLPKTEIERKVPCAPSDEMRERFAEAMDDLSTRKTHFSVDLPVLYCEEVTSTMDIAREFSAEELLQEPHTIVGNVPVKNHPHHSISEWSCVLARTQTAGRGRQQRVWQSPKGAGIYFTLRFTLSSSPASLIGYPLAIAVAIAEALREFQANVGLKWPNDIWILDPTGTPQGKIAGILIESTEMAPGKQQVLVGAGINLIPADGTVDFRRVALAEVTDEECEFEKVFVATLSSIVAVTNRFFAERRTEIFDRWRELSFLWGRPVKVQVQEGTLEGVCVDIDDQGGLIIELESPKRRHTIYSNEILLADFALNK